MHFYLKSVQSKKWKSESFKQTWKFSVYPVKREKSENSSDKDEMQASMGMGAPMNEALVDSIDIPEISVGLGLLKLIKIEQKTQKSSDWQGRRTNPTCPTTIWLPSPNGRWKQLERISPMYSARAASVHWVNPKLMYTLKPSMFQQSQATHPRRTWARCTPRWHAKRRQCDHNWVERSGRKMRTDHWQEWGDNQRTSGF